MMNRCSFLILIIASVMTSGCAVNTVPAVDSYMINNSCGVEIPSGKNSEPSKVLKISRPKSTAAIMSRNILYQEKEFVQNPYVSGKWSDTPNRMLASLFLSCVNKSSVFTSVLPSYSRGKADLLLESTLLDFYHHVNSDGGSEGRVRIEFYLIESKSGKVVATNEFDSKINSKTLDVNGGVMAINDASKSVALSLIQWLSSLDD